MEIDSITGRLVQEPQAPVRTLKTYSFTMAQKMLLKRQLVKEPEKISEV
jgi:hypothetical protein